MADARRDVEVLTPPGAGGIAVIRLVGKDRHARAAQLLAHADRANDAPFQATTTPRIARLVIDGVVLDQVLVVDRPTHAAIEIHLHGSAALLDALAPARDSASALAALSPADGLLRFSTSDAQLAVSLEQRCHDWSEFRAALGALPEPRRAIEIAAARRRSVISRAIFEPQRIVICGLQNAGKSTLLNRLLFRERALTGPLPGLTRDSVRDTVELGGYPYELVDTAGEVGSDVPMLHPIDRRAIERARDERESAAIRLLVLDVTRGYGVTESGLYRSGQTLVVCNKMDLHAEGFDGLRMPRPYVTVSCLHPADASSVRSTIGTALSRLRGLPLRPGPVGGPAALNDIQRAELDPGRV